jgi:NAD(P)-dependent dehydrogenase (short-subunit alcohol dehydrogenase family)
MVLLPRAFSRRVFITGCSSGLGRRAALYLAGADMDVVATTRRTDDADQLHEIACSPGIPLTVVLLNLLDEQSVGDAVADAAGYLGGIDVLINNAGVELKGPIEEISDEEFHWQFDTNVLGTFRATKSTLPLLRASDHAKIIFVSSVVGFAAHPFIGVYSASKYAIEGLAEALHFELEPFDISVTLIEPGKFQSALSHNQRIARSFTTESIYHEHSERFSAATSQLLSPSHDPDPVVIAEAIHRVIDHPAPPLHVPVGADDELTVRMRARPPFEPYADHLTERLGARTPHKTTSRTDGGTA